MNKNEVGLNLGSVLSPFMLSPNSHDIHCHYVELGGVELTESPQQVGATAAVGPSDGSSLAGCCTLYKAETFRRKGWPSGNGAFVDPTERPNVQTFFILVLYSKRGKVVAAPLLVRVVVIVVGIVVLGMLAMITISTVAAFGEAS